MIDGVLHYLEDCLRVATSHGAWGLILLFAPALAFDATRYYLPNVLYFVGFLFSRLLPRKKEEEIPDSELPFLSVIVPAYNEGENLRMTLDSILLNDYPRFEVLVVDDASTDSTPEIAREYQKAGKIRYLRRVCRGSKPSSLNYGLQFARGEILLHMDGDTILRPHALREVVKPFRDPRVGCVSGNLNVKNADKNLWTKIQAAEFGMTINVQRRWLSLTDMLQIASGAFGVFRKRVLLALCGVDAEYGEDSDVSLKVRKMGYHIVFCPEAVGMTEMPENLAGISRQRLRWDRCYIRVNLRKHGNLMNLQRFRFGDFANFFLDFFFNLVLLFVFPIYILFVVGFVPKLTLFILVVTYAYYTLANLIQILIAVCLSEKPWRDLRWLALAPLFFPYSMYLRFVRALAYALEGVHSPLLKGRYFPEYVVKQMPRD